MGHPLRQEDGPVIYSHNCFWVLPEQWLLGRSPAELMAIFYCLIWDSPNLVKIRVKVICYDRRSVGQSALVLGTHLGPTTNSSHSLFDYFFWQFRVCWCGEPSLARSRVCTFRFLPGIASAAFLWSEFHRTHEHSLLSLFFRLPQPGGPGAYIYFPQEQGSPILASSIGLPSGTGLQQYIYIYIYSDVWVRFLETGTQQTSPGKRVSRDKSGQRAFPWIPVVVSMVTKREKLNKQLFLWGPT
jgi:hypothetical protein